MHDVSGQFLLPKIIIEKFLKYLRADPMSYLMPLCDTR